MKRPKVKSSSALLQSLKIINTILSDEGRPQETHVRLQDNWAVAHNGVLGIGEKIAEDLYACPNAHTLEAALAKCGESLSITQLEQKLSITSGKFRALVPCLPPENMPRSFPDAPCARVNDSLKASIAAVAPLALEGEDSVVTASLLIHGGTVTATDRRVIIQSWHGLDLPPNLALPKAIIQPLIKNPKALAQFGYSKSSCTFFFEDESYIMSQFYADKWPDVGPILDKKSNQWKLPEDFYEGVKALEPFSEDGFIYFDTNKMLSHPDESVGASYEIYGLPKGPSFNIKQLKMIQPFMKTVDFMAQGQHGSNMLLFFGDNIRGGIAGRV